MARTKKAKTLEAVISSPALQKSVRDFLYGRGMKAKKPDQYLKTCYLCGTACSATKNSKAVWITDKVVASVCGGCYERIDGFTKKDTARPDLKTLGVKEDDFLIGAGLLSSWLGSAKTTVRYGYENQERVKMEIVWQSTITEEMCERLSYTEIRKLVDELNDMVQRTCEDFGVKG